MWLHPSAWAGLARFVAAVVVRAGAARSARGLSAVGLHPSDGTRCARIAAVVKSRAALVARDLPRRELNPPARARLARHLSRRVLVEVAGTRLARVGARGIGELPRAALGARRRPGDAREPSAGAVLTGARSRVFEVAFRARLAAGREGLVGDLPPVRAREALAHAVHARVPVGRARLARVRRRVLVLPGNAGPALDPAAVRHGPDSALTARGRAVSGGSPVQRAVRTRALLCFLGKRAGRACGAVERKKTVANLSLTREAGIAWRARPAQHPIRRIAVVARRP